MKKVFKKIISLFKKTEPSRKRIMRKTRGQSFVEFAITLPLLLMLLASVVEYGFMLNYYLSMLDATRTAARFYSGLDPFQADHVTDNMVFYNQVAVMVQDGMNPLIATPGYVGRTIPLDPLLDDIIVSVYGIEGNTVYSHPDSGPYHFYSNGVNNSIFNAKLLGG